MTAERVVADLGIAASDTLAFRRRTVRIWNLTRQTQVAEPLPTLACEFDEALVDVEGEFECREGAGGLDVVDGMACQAGHHPVPSPTSSPL